MFDFYKNKRVLVTGHTGFKGTWLCRILMENNAKVMGYALPAPTNPSLFDLLNLSSDMHSIIGDIRDRDRLFEVFLQFQPEVVFHLAAQPIVREGYRDPVYTYETNVMGTVNLMECIRQTESVISALNVTTDKVYLNREWDWGYRENEQLEGFDPYSNSKSCSELVTHSYNNSYFFERGIPVSTARAGNVIGGGDFANDRIIPDCVRAAEARKPILVRNPHSTRPYQHVLDPLWAYLTIVEKQATCLELADYYNVGPNDNDCISTKDLVETFCQEWGEGMTWEGIDNDAAPHEANFLKLDCSKIKKKLAWNPRWNIHESVHHTCNWTKTYMRQGDVSAEIQREIESFKNAGATI